VLFQYFLIESVYLSYFVSFKTNVPDNIPDIIKKIQTHHPRKLKNDVSKYLMIKFDVTRFFQELQKP